MENAIGARYISHLYFLSQLVYLSTDSIRANQINDGERDLNNHSVMPDDFAVMSKALANHGKNDVATTIKMSAMITFLFLSSIATP